MQKKIIFKWFIVKFLYLGRIMFRYQPLASRKFSGKADTSGDYGLFCSLCNLEKV